MPRHAIYNTSAWGKLRRLALIRDGYHCTVCDANVSGFKQARIDHIKKISTHPHLSLDIDNVRTLCVVCDGQAHRERAKGGQIERDEQFVALGCGLDGWPYHRGRK